MDCCSLANSSRLHFNSQSPERFPGSAWPVSSFWPLSLFLVLRPHYLPACFTDLDFAPVFSSFWAWYFLLFKLCFACFCFSFLYLYFSANYSLIFLIYSLLLITLLFVSRQYILLSSCQSITKLHKLLWNTIQIDVISTLSSSLLYPCRKSKDLVLIYLFSVWTAPWCRCNAVPVLSAPGWFPLRGIINPTRLCPYLTM